jgi:polyphosphate glucokinase
MAEILGIDIGGTGIKGAPVDTLRGNLLAERFRVDTPQPASPKSVAAAVAQVVKHFNWKGPIGITLPSVVKNGQVHTAANIDKGWIGLQGQSFLSKELNCPVVLLNDADAAGIAEMRFGAGRNKDGLVVIVTLGTGIGTALFYNGHLVPNSELGHLEINGRDAERKASNRVREEKELSWKEWSKNVNRYLTTLEALLWPNLFLIGGGVSKKADKFLPRLKLHAPVKPAELMNDAGIVGAALAAEGLGGVSKARVSAKPAAKAKSKTKASRKKK